MARVKPVEHQFEKFLRMPLSVRKAMAVIVTATVMSVVIGGVVITVVDERDFPHVGTGLWWALQTVTTVGYGDVIPRNTVGRLVGSVIMLESTAFIAIVTAAITSSFVERARREQAAAAAPAPAGGDHTAAGGRTAAGLAGQLADITARLDVIQRTLEAGASPGGERHG